MKTSLRTPTRRFFLETLEDRCVLSATFGENALVTTASGQLEVVPLAAGQSLQDLRAAYPSALSIEPDYRIQIERTPNDTSYTSLYAMPLIDAPEAWETTVGSTRMSVAVIDTGIDYTHPDLFLNIWINQREIPSTVRSNLIDIDGDNLITFYDLNDTRNQGPGKITDLNANGRIDAGDILRPSSQGGWADGTDAGSNGYTDDLVGWNFVNNTNNPFDDEGHGTHVAGTIGAIGNNSRGVVGVNWKVQMAALKFLDANGSGSTSAAVSALNYAVNNGIPISNNSWGGGGFSTSLSNAISSARTAGHIFVAAAGNSNRNNDTTANYPSNYNFDNVVSVASTTSTDARSSFSNFGATTVDLAAPGSSILSTLPNNRYGSLSGTSMATPHVAGAIALVWSTDTTQTYNEVIDRILDNVDVISGLNGVVATSGRLNVNKALRASAPVDSSGPRVVSAVADSATRPTRIRLTFSEAINPASFTLADITGFVGPKGVALSATSITAVTGSNNTQFDVNFSALSTVGSYRFDVGPGITDTAGNAMDQSQNGVNGETGDVYRVTFAVTGFTTMTFSNNTSVAVRDFSTSSSSIVISQDVNISDINVRLNVNHTYVGDLYIWLRGPDGTEVLLSNYRGGSGDNYRNTTFDDSATTAIRNGSAPFAGTFRPEGLLSAYNNTSARGTWQLFVYDGARFDTGTLTGWSLIVSGNTNGTLRRSSTDAAPAESDATVSARDTIFATLPSTTTGVTGVNETPTPEATTQTIESRIGHAAVRDLAFQSFSRAARRTANVWTDSLGLA